MHTLWYITTHSITKLSVSLGIMLYDYVLPFIYINPVEYAVILQSIQTTKYSTKETLLSKDTTASHQEPESPLTPLNSEHPESPIDQGQGSNQPTAYPTQVICEYYVTLHCWRCLSLGSSNTLSFATGYGPRPLSYDRINLHGDNRAYGRTRTTWSLHFSGTNWS